MLAPPGQQRESRTNTQLNRFFYTDALIVGASAPGLYAAYELARHGLSVRIIDPRPDPAPKESPDSTARPTQGADQTRWDEVANGIALHARTLESFQASGIVEDVLSADVGGSKLVGVTLRSSEEFDDSEIVRTMTLGVMGKAGLKTLSRIAFDQDDFVSSTGTPFPFLYSLPYENLQKVLRKKLSELPVPIEVEYGTSFVSSKFVRPESATDEPHLEATLMVPDTFSSDDGTVSYDEDNFSTRFIIGADGHNSAVRQSIFNWPMESESEEQRFIISDCHIENLQDEALTASDVNITYHKDGIVMAVPIDKETSLYRVVTQMPVSRSEFKPSVFHASAVKYTPYQFDDLAKIVGFRTEYSWKPTKAKWTQEVRINERMAKEYMWPFAAPGPDTSRRPSAGWLSMFGRDTKKKPTVTAPEVAPAAPSEQSTQVTGRIFLVGDAAHVFNPLGSQGLNLGLQEVQNLAWKLALACRGGTPSSSSSVLLLETYGRERMRVAETAFSLSSSGGSGVPNLFSIDTYTPATPTLTSSVNAVTSMANALSSSAVTRAFRDVLVPVLLKVPAATSLIRQSVLGLDHVYPSGPEEKPSSSNGPASPTVETVTPKPKLYLIKSQSCAEKFGEAVVTSATAAVTGTLNVVPGTRAKDGIIYWPVVTNTDPQQKLLPPIPNASTPADRDDDTATTLFDLFKNEAFRVPVHTVVVFSGYVGRPRSRPSSRSTSPAAGRRTPSPNPESSAIQPYNTANVVSPPKKHHRPHLVLDSLLVQPIMTSIAARANDREQSALAGRTQVLKEFLEKIGERVGEAYALRRTTTNWAVGKKDEVLVKVVVVSPYEGVAAECGGWIDEDGSLHRLYGVGDKPGFAVVRPDLVIAAFGNADEPSIDGLNAFLITFLRKKDTV
ncbi:hypothetical protein BJ742DRAFT_545319 [Cladochytrium replicatum]|nr:hypothetical protein BJ742DRAFT_545319 [Cladochytrium replicatum]